MERRHFIKGLIGAGACPICAKVAFASDVQWGYRGDDGPDHWAEIDPHFFACSKGMQQSPIDIAEDVAAQLPALAVDWKNDPAKMVNNGHTIQIDVPAGSRIRRGDEAYDLVQYHFHAPSEHHVKGKTFPMEAHFVHRNPETGSFGVLAVFLEPGAANETFSALAAAFPDKSGMEVKIEDIDPNGLVPASLEYWLYEGSLTTPPCSEDVDWMIARTPVRVDAEDIARFAALYPKNARPIRLPNRRFILSSSGS